jgi:opacity protein-like surface antigen
MKTSIGQQLSGMKNIGLLALCLMGMNAAVHAADDPLPRRIFEGTVLGGKAFGGSFDDKTTTKSTNIESGSVYGVALNMESSDQNAFYEFDYIRDTAKFGKSSPLDLSLEYIHVGGYISTTDDPKRIAPYFLMTVGATRITPNLGLSNLSAFSLAAGAGVRFPITRHIAVRLDGRMYATFLDKKEDLFCDVTDTTCTFHFEGTTMFRGVASLGASVRF